MMNRMLVALALAVPFFAGCDSFGSVSLGKGEGIPPVSGSTVVDVPQDYKCGDPITDPKGKYTVKSAGTQDKCTFSFHQDVTALKASDYDSRPELKGAQFIERVDFDVSKLDVTDATTGKELDPATRLLDLVGQAFKTTILTKADVGKAPFTKSVEGEPIDALKSQVQAKQDIIVPVDVEVVVALNPMPPAQIGLDFEAQPNIIVGF